MSKVTASGCTVEGLVRLHKWAKWITNHPPEYGADHACERCYPHSDIIKAWYVCAYHEAIDYLESNAESEASQ